MTLSCGLAGRLRTPSLGTLLDTPFPPRDHLIAPWLRQGESAMVWAPTGVGKTMFGLTIALAVAGGGTFMGWSAPRPRRVLVVDGEMNMADLVDRLKLLAPAVEGLDLEAARGGLKVLSRQHQDPDAEFPDLAQPEGRDCIFAMVQAGGYDLVILDNFSTLASVEDENAASAMNPVIAFLMRLKQANVACILVHHSGKTKTDFRGSSKLSTTFEVIIGLREPSGTAALKGTAFDLVWTKFRGRRDESIRGRSVCLEASEGGPARWVYALSQDEEAEEVVHVIRSCRYATQAALAEELGCSTGKLSGLKAQAIRRGLISAADWTACLDAAREAAADRSPFEGDCGAGGEASTDF
jgi:KaiC/GvpD/RAD55 family RecA-like ATPase